MKTREKIRRMPFMCLMAVAISGLILAPAKIAEASEMDGTEESGFYQMSDRPDIWYDFQTKIKDSLLSQTDMPTEVENQAGTYDQVTYDPTMFYGNYRIYHEDRSVSYADGEVFADQQLAADYRQNGHFSLLTDYYSMSGQQPGMEGAMISCLPCAFVAGPNNLNGKSASGFLGGGDAISYDELSIARDDINWCLVTYGIICQGETGEEMKELTSWASYEVTDQGVCLKFLMDATYDEEQKLLTLQFLDHEMNYQYSFAGLFFGLQCQDGANVTMVPRSLDRYDEVSCKSADLSEETEERFQDVEQIGFRVMKTEDGFSMMCRNWEDEEAGYIYPMYQLSEDGKAELAIYDKKNNLVNAYEMLLFYCGKDGVIAADQTGVYPYLKPFTGPYDDEIEATVLIEAISGDKVEQAKMLKQEFLNQLMQALQEAGVSADYYEATGEIKLSTDILFDKNMADLKEEGKVTLDQFITCFMELQNQEEYNGFIKSVLVRGYTDSDSEYDYNLRLSEERAENVADFWQNGSSLSEYDKEKLSEMVITEGYGENYLIYDGNGVEDMAASRRVAIYFEINWDFLEE